MKGERRSSKQLDSALSQTMIADYQCASIALSELASDFRARESRLRELSAVLLNQPCPAELVTSKNRSKRLMVSFFCLGKFRAEFQGVPVTSGRSKALKILKFLVQGHRPCTSELLIETFWPETEPHLASNRLRVEVHALRQIFSVEHSVKDIIVYHDGCYELNPEIDFWIDAAVFETLWHLGARYETESRFQEAARSYEHAVRLYMGDYLEEDLYEEWTLFRRESLRDSYLYLLGKLADWCAEEGNYGGSISYCHKMLAQDRYREDAYRLLMRCYLALGQRATALRWYDICRTNLQKGLDVTPSPETVKLRNQIIAREG